MTIQECIDRVDSLKPNQYTIKEKVEWLSFIELRIINDVLKTHEGYDGRYDLFTGYSEDKLTITMIAPSPYDRLYTKYLEMKIDEANGETTRYNNSATMFNTYYADYKKYYNKGHMPLDPLSKADKKVPTTAQVGLTDAEYDSLVKELTYNLTEYFSDRLSDDKIYEIVNAFVLNNIQMLKGKDGRDGIDGKDGYTPRKNVDYFDGKKGDNGDPGYTPQRGIDYFTDADKEAIKKYTDDVAERKFATAESKDNKMAAWDDDKVSRDTYPSSAAMVEGTKKIHSNMLDVELEEGGKINKAIKESGGGGSAVQPDYNQNDETQPDYIKNRPFYEGESTIIAEKLLDYQSSGIGLGDIRIPFPDVNVGDTFKVELTYHGKVASSTLTIVENAFDNITGAMWVISSPFSAAVNIQSGCLSIVSEDGTPGADDTIRVMGHIVVPIDEKFLPKSVITEKNVGNYVSHTVPYIYGSDDEPVRVEALPSGAYILHGMFLTSLDAPIYDFYDEPNLCIVRNTGTIQLTWFNTAIGESGPTAFARYMFIQEGEILFDNSAPLC